VKEIEFTSAAVRQWRKLTATTRAQIDLKLKAFAESGIRRRRCEALKGAAGMRLRSVKSNVQFIHTPGGDDLAVLPRIEYDRLVALATEAQEDASASRIVRSSTRALKEGREVVLPKAVADRLANGDNAVRVIREWRDMIQGELAVAVGISQNYLSEIETGRRKGPAELQKKFARALGVPVDLLIE
jgi:DNA-binding XRE family transcriptional regulator